MKRKKSYGCACGVGYLIYFWTRVPELNEETLRNEIILRNEEETE